MLAAFDLFALASRKEGLPYVVLEAMAAGLPVVATASAGVEILIDPGITGAVVAPDDADAFAQALIRLVSNPPLLARWGQASRQRATLFSIDAMVDRTLAAYRDAVHHHPAPHLHVPAPPRLRPSHVPLRTPAPPAPPLIDPDPANALQLVE